MRKVIEPQMMFRETDIGAIVLDPKSRDDTPQILRGPQYIYTEPSLREPVFAMLEEVLAERGGSESNASSTTRLPGMEQWKILVLGVLRLVTPEFILDPINQEAVRAGHRAKKESKESLEEGLRGRCDSFVMETDVHFPTDINLLRDAIRKILQTCARLSETHGLTEWRQSAHHICQFEKDFRQILKFTHSISKDERKRQMKEKTIGEARRIYLEQAEGYLRRARRTRQHLKIDCGVPAVLLAKLDGHITGTVLEL